MLGVDFTAAPYLFGVVRIGARIAESGGDETFGEIAESRKNRIGFVAGYRIDRFA